MNDMKNKCEVYYFSDMQICVKCDLGWDANDPCPPRCPNKTPEPVGPFGRIFAFLFKAKGGGS